MQTKDNPNPTPLEPARQDPSVEAMPPDAFNCVMAILSEIPTDRAMKELGRLGAPIPATRQAVETLALWKDTLVKCLRLMKLRETALQMYILRKDMTQADKAMADYIKLNPNFKIVLESD